VATECSGGSPASPPHPTKVACPGLGTRRPGQATERRRWKKGSGAEEREEAGTVRRQRRTPRGGARGGVLDLAMAEPSTPVTSGESGSAMGATMERGGVRIG
jgi:hypothetical protein